MTKKGFSVLLCALMLITLAAGCAALKKDDARAQYVGTWTLTRITSEGTDLIIDDLDEEEKADVSITLELKEDGTGIMTGSGQSDEGLWKVADNGIKLVGDDDSVFTLMENGELRWTMTGDDSMELFFKKTE